MICELYNLWASSYLPKIIVSPTVAVIIFGISYSNNKINGENSKKKNNNIFHKNCSNLISFNNSIKNKSG